MPAMSETLVVGVDFSKRSAMAARWAIDHASRMGAEVLLVHVVHDPGVAPGSYQTALPTGVTRSMEDAATEMMATFVADLGPVRTRIVVGLPVTRLIEVAKAEEASMLVIGNQGRSALARLVLGSKAARLVQLAPMPVTVVKEWE